MRKGYLKLETGEVFPGNIIGEGSGPLGEVVFHTSMTGHDEIIKDPVYAGQILVFTYPIIANKGMDSSSLASLSHPLSGVVMGEVCQDIDEEDGTMSLANWIEEAKIPGLVDVDTRALVKTIRKYGTVYGKISDKADDDIVMDQGKSELIGSLVESLSTKEVFSYEQGGPHIAILDGGSIKTILQALLEEDCSVTILPISSTYEEVKELAPDAVIISNGPGDPKELAAYFSNIKKVSSSLPTLGIGLGHQLIALAFGASRVKLAQGHRGVNQPVKELRTKKVYMTAQSHGYAINKKSLAQTSLVLTYENVNDKTVEGLKHTHLPIQTVQFQPVAEPGPSDTAFLFKEFIQAVKSARGKIYA